VATATAPTTPFACQHTPQIPDLLAEMGASLALTTYQAGKVLIVSAEGERLVHLPRTFDTPMGLAVDGERMALATRQEIVLLANEPRLAGSYPRQPHIYDALFVPRSVHFTGALTVHDLAFAEGGLVGVNTLFSCLFELDPFYSFRPIWRPPFVGALAPEDRCHLNGLALEAGHPRFVTALGATDGAGGWRDAKERGGVIVDVPTGEIVLAGLPMPHSPRIVDGTLYALLSATGEIIAVDVERGQYDVVRRVDGFARGLAYHADHLFVATSRFREHHTFADLDLPRDGRAFCGVSVLHRDTGAFVGDLRFLRSCEEIYDVQVLPGRRRPGILGLADDTHRRALTTPEQTFWAVEREDGNGRQPG